MTSNKLLKPNCTKEGCDVKAHQWNVSLPIARGLDLDDL